MPDRSDVEVEARSATPEEIPASAVSMEKLARKAGFDTRVTYARGMNYAMRDSAVVDSVAVRMRHPDGTRITALYMRKPGKGYAFDAALRASPLRRISSPVLRRYLKIKAVNCNAQG